ncbi:MAG: hypothetical protein AAGI25_18730 [Bacteroidota bacterium]
MAKNYVIDGAKIKFNSHTGTFKVLADVPKIQDKLAGTIIEKAPLNFIFDDGFMLSTLGDWAGYGDVKFQGSEVLLEDSTIQGVGRMPGALFDETGKVEFIDSGQISEFSQLQPIAGPFIDPIIEPEIISLEWKSNKAFKDKDKTVDLPDEVIEETTAGEKTWLEAFTQGMLPGETLDFEIVEKKDPDTVLLNSEGYIDTEGYTRIELKSADDIDFAKQTLVATATYFDQKTEASITITPKLPKLQGEIIFVNGFLSDPIHNTEATLYNAILDKTSDEPDSGALKGENADEHNRTHPDDIDTAQEKRDRDNAPEKTTKEKVMDFLKNPLQDFAFTPDEKYYGYWNSIENEYLSTKTYARYFHAEDHVHYINGSHDLGSNGAHRIDHGIALGYTWAKKIYTIFKNKIVEDYKDDMPSVEQFSPKYKPVTIVGHSHGACMAAGVALGVIKYAADMGYDKIPINIIFLGVHQPKGLFGKEYDRIVDIKVNRYEVNYSFPNLSGKNEDFGDKFLNSLAEIFSEEHKKIYHNRGLYEHIKAISNWSAYKSRALQFTFTNDRADLVLIDGDIPQIPSACNPKRDNTLLSVEYYDNLPILNDASKEIIDLKNHQSEGGFIVLPKYIANKRFDFKALDDMDNPTREQQKLGVQWGDYKIVAVRWGTAMYRYRTLKNQYEQQTENTYSYSNKVAEEYKEAMYRLSNWLADKDPFAGDLTEEEERQLEQRKKELDLRIQVTDAFETMLKKYAALQNADLYAHFSPVAMIHHSKIVEDFPDDALGNQSIWQRIQNLGKDMFYRVKYDKNPDESEPTEQQKRKKEKEEVEGKLKNKLIDTAIGNTEYIKNVIKAYVHKSKAAANHLYHEAKDEK